LRWREENRSALLQPATGGRDSIDSVGGGTGARPSSAGVSSLGQMLRQKYWQQDTRARQSADTQDSNVLGGAVLAADRRDDDSSAGTLADLPPSYTSKSATLPLDSRRTDEEMVLDDDDRDWQSPQPTHDEPVQSIEFAEDSEDEVPDFQDSPLGQSDMVASGSSQLAPVTETAIDDDYELIHVQPTRPHHDLVQPSDSDLHLHARAQSPVVASLHPSRRASPALSDSSASYHHTPVEPHHGSQAAIHRPHKPPPPPPPPRRHHHHVEESIPTVPFDPFESLPPPADMMMQYEEPDEEVVEEAPVPQTDELHPDDDSASTHPYWPGSKPTDL